MKFIILNLRKIFALAMGVNGALQSERNGKVIKAKI